MEIEDQIVSGLLFFTPHTCNEKTEKGKFYECFKFRT